jgi:hypothetical protein
MGASTSWNPKGPSRPAMGLFYKDSYIYTKDKNTSMIRFGEWNESLASIYDIFLKYDVLCH